MIPFFSLFFFTFHKMFPKWKNTFQNKLCPIWLVYGISRNTSERFKESPKCYGDFLKTVEWKINSHSARRTVTTPLSQPSQALCECSCSPCSARSEETTHINLHINAFLYFCWFCCNVLTKGRDGALVTFCALHEHFCNSGACNGMTITIQRKGDCIPLQLQHSRYLHYR